MLVLARSQGPSDENVLPQQGSAFLSSADTVKHYLMNLHVMRLKISSDANFRSSFDENEVELTHPF